MGFFDKIKKKVTEAVSSATEAVGFNRLVDGLEKTRNNFVGAIQNVIGKGRKIDTALLEEIEEILITADIGVATTDFIIEELKLQIKNKGYENSEDVIEALKTVIFDMLIKSPSSDNDAIYAIDDSKKPHTVMVIGVNGVGKTTTVGKLAYNYKSNGHDVLIAAADTFRAAANEQIEVWAQRADVSIIQQKQGADPAAVAYDSLKSAIAKNIPVVLIDTAGRLHNKGNLMSELSKISRVVKKINEEAPHEVFLVLDATTGQNAILQAKEFMKVASVTGIVLTKLDGTAKGGVILPIAHELKLPVRYIGVGEKINDLQLFDPDAFIAALFEGQKIADTDN